MNKRRFRLIVFLAGAALLNLIQLQTALAMPTASAVEALIHSSNDTKRIKNISAGIAQKDVIISTFREQSSSENDLKIDAILLARLLYVPAYCVEFTAVRSNNPKPRLRHQLFFNLGSKVYMCQMACDPEDRIFYTKFLEKFLASLRAQ